MPTPATQPRHSRARGFLFHPHVICCAAIFVRFRTKAIRLLDRHTPPQRRLAQKKEGHVLKTKRPESEDPGIIPRPSYCELLQAYIDKYSTHVSVTTTSCAGYQ